MSMSYLWDGGEQKAFKAWKKLRDGTICELEIPSDSKRYITCGIGRAEFAKVIEGEGVSEFGGLAYRVGEIVNCGVNCCGIYFYLSREQAENHVF